MTRNQKPALDGVDERIAPLGEVLSFMRLLWAIAHGLDAASKRMRVTIGVTGPQRLVLRIVGHFKETSAGELARVLHVHPSSLTGVLRRLDGARLIQRERDPNDHRRAVLRLTPRGQRLNAQRTETVEAVVRRALSRSQRAKLEATEEVLRAVADELDAHWGKRANRGTRKHATKAPGGRGRSAARRV